MGKMILLVVLGTYMILGGIMLNNGNIATDTVDNVVDYYSKANSKHIAGSGANLALGEIYNDLSWNAGFNNVDFSGGKLNVTLTPDSTLGPNGLRIFSTSNYMGYKDSVIVEIALEYFSRYLMFINKNPGGYYVTGDTMNGPFHTNDKLWTAGKPVFKGRVTMGKGPMKSISWNGDKAEPEFWGGYDYVKGIPMPGNLKDIENAAAAKGFNSKDELWITLNNDNTITFRTSKNGQDSTINASALAPNGLIYSKKDIHLQGKIDGSLTIASDEDIWLDDDVGVMDDPQKNPNSSQMLGIVSNKNIIVTDNTANSNDINISAAMYTNKSFEIENLYSGSPRGHINMFGSLTQDADGFTGVMSGNKIIHGYNLNYNYDYRMTADAPPEFPLTDRMQILRWWE